MSRLIVKGLPKHLTEERMKEHFASAGEVTDARIRRTKEGRSRQFGFLGFRSEEEAKNAKRMFHNTFLDTSKLNIEVARPYGDAEIPRGWSKYTKGSSGYEKLHGETGETTEKTGQKVQKGTAHKHAPDSKPDPKLAEFMAVAQPRRNKQFWANDEAMAMSRAQRKTQVASKKAGGKDVMLTRSHVTFESDSEDAAEDAEEEEDAAEDEDEPEAYDGNDDVAGDTTVNDMDYLRSKMVSDEVSDEDFEEPIEDGAGSGDEEHDPEVQDEEVVEGDGQLEEERQAEDDQEPSPAASALDREGRAQGEDEDDVEPLSESGRLFVRNLPYTATAEDLEELFQAFGALAEVHLCIDKTSKASKGMAFVLYVIPEHAVKALAELDGTFFMGRILHILPAKKKPQSQPIPQPEDGSEQRGATSSYKRKKEMELKEAARSKSDVVAYNPLFMGTDAVAGALAERYSVNKADVLGDEDAAVRLATGEAQLQEEARQVLTKEGVNVEAFSMMDKVSNKTKRSRTVILVKNLPAGTRPEHVRDRFSKFGTVGRLVVVPSGLIAIVEFMESSEARKAYGAIAYSRFKDKPIYLEWAPLNAFKTQIESAPVKSTTQKANGPDVAQQHGDADPPTGDAAEPEEVQTSTVFVKNLNFKTGDEEFRRLFGKKLKVRGARVARRKTDSKSLGYGFVEFDSTEDAANAVKKLQGAELDGHKLELKFSAAKKRKQPDGAADNAKPPAPPNGASATKLVVRNLAFEASAKELRKLFSAYGEVKSVVVPKKFDGTSRGFGFVEFKSKAEAAAALSALRAAHFYARRLIMEYAQADADELEDKDEALELRMDKESKRARVTKRTKSGGGDADGAPAEDGDVEADYEMYA